MSTVIVREDTNYRVAHVETFVWDPITPVALSINDYQDTVALSIEEAQALAEGLLLAIKQYNNGR